ncbi:MAG: flagellar biosynthetic protein FliO [Planctomycetes bacterium]|nr:flagellar biosynthetic protein FliO [Planctomycetota bacterium]
MKRCGPIRFAMFAAVSVVAGAATSICADSVTPGNASGTEPASTDAVASWVKQATSGDPEHLLPRRDGGRLTATREPSVVKAESGLRSMDLLWPMVVVLGLIVGGTLALRRWTPVAQRISARGGLQILGRHYLSGKQSLCLVRLGRRVVCIGVTPEHISTLAEIHDPEEIAGLVAGVQAATPHSFSSIFTRMAAQPAPTEVNDSADSLVGGNSTRARAATEVQDLLSRVRNWSRFESSAEPVNVADSVSTA